MSAAFKIQPVFWRMERMIYKESFQLSSCHTPSKIYTQRHFLLKSGDMWFLVFCLFFRVEKLTTTDRWSFPELQSDVLFPLCSIWHLCRHTHGGSMPSLKRVKGISQVPEFLSSCWKTPDSLHYGIPTAASKGEQVRGRASSSWGREGSHHNDCRSSPQWISLVWIKEPIVSSYNVI